MGDVPDGDIEIGAIAFMKIAKGDI